MSLARRTWLAVLCVAALGVGVVPAAQAAFDDPLSIYDPTKLKPPRPPLEGLCGVAVDSVGKSYLSEYYHHTVGTIKNVDPLDGPCGLALDVTGALYVNNFHRNVEKFVPSIFPTTGATTYAPAGIVDANHPTGVAVDAVTANVFVNARTEVNVYDPSGAPVLDGADPLTIGQGSLTDAYGLAVSGFPATAGRLYVPDAGTDTVKVYDPAVDTANPVATIDGSATPSGEFVSLRDAVVAVDRVSGEIYVADNLQPEYTERPETVVYVFAPTGSYEGRLKYSVINGEPPGLAVDNSPTATQGRVYLSSGNTEGAILYTYPPGAATSASVPLGALGPVAGPEGPSHAGAPGVPGAPGAPKGPGAPASTSAITQKGTLRVTVNGKLAPKKLPRVGSAPISVSVGGEVTTTDQSLPPQLQSLQIELNRNGRLDTKGLPTCPYGAIQPASTSRALNACRSALVGEGSFKADITLSGQVPYPTKGKLLVFNAKSKGKPVLFGQIYAPRPFASSFVIVFEVKHLGKGTYGTALTASLPEALGSWGNLTAIEMTLSRRFSYKGEPHSYISAGCPAPKGFPGAVFPLARTSFGFAGGRRLTSVLSGSCEVG